MCLANPRYDPCRRIRSPAPSRTTGCYSAPCSGCARYAETSWSFDSFHRQFLLSVSPPSFSSAWGRGAAFSETKGFQLMEHVAATLNDILNELKLIRMEIAFRSGSAQQGRAEQRGTMAEAAPSVDYQWDPRSVSVVKEDAHFVFSE